MEKHNFKTGDVLQASALNEIENVIDALQTTVSGIFDMMDDIHYITSNTKATMISPSTLDSGVYICIVKQDEDYPKEGGEVGECYSTLYICVVDDSPSWEFIGKLNISEKMLESMIASASASANVYSNTETVIGSWLGKTLYRIVGNESDILTDNTLIPTITSANDSILTSTVIGGQSNCYVYGGYDNVASTYWQNALTTTVYLGYNFGNTTTVSSVTMQNASFDSNDIAVSPTEWILQGSNDGTNWEDLETKKTVWNAKNQVQTIALEKDYSYKMFRVNFVKNNGFSANYYRLAKLQFNVKKPNLDSLDFVVKKDFANGNNNIVIVEYTKTTD